MTFRKLFSTSLPLLLSLLLFFFSCKEESERVPSGLLPKDKMIDVLLDIHLLESAVEVAGMSDNKIQQMMAGKYPDILNSHQTTYKQFVDSYDYYLHHPEVMDDIYQEIVNRLTALESKSHEHLKPKPMVPRDSLQGRRIHLPPSVQK